MTVKELRDRLAAMGDDATVLVGIKSIGTGGPATMSDLSQVNEFIEGNVVVLSGRVL